MLSSVFDYGAWHCLMSCRPDFMCSVLVSNWLSNVVALSLKKQPSRATRADAQILLFLS